jgi:hypothetical protein
VCHKCKGNGFEILIVPDSVSPEIASKWAPAFPFSKEEVMERVAWVKKALPKILKWQAEEGPIVKTCPTCLEEFESHYSALRHTPSCAEFTRQKARHGGFHTWPNNPFLTDKQEDFDAFFALVEDTLGSEVMATAKSFGKVALNSNYATE